MTTIVWNGQTMVAYTRQTFTIDGKIVKREDNVIKMMKPSAVFRGEAVEMMGISGDTRLLTYFATQDPAVDLAGDEFYHQLGIPELTAITCLMLVTATRLVLIEIDPVKGTWKFLGGDRSTSPAAIGTGAKMLEEILPYRFDARLYVSFASWFDRCTGSKFTVWRGGPVETAVRYGFVKTISLLFLKAFTWRKTK